MTAPAAQTSPGPSPSPGSGVTIAPEYLTIQARTVEFPVRGVTFKGYLAQPGGVTWAPGIVVIHKNQGLNVLIKDMVRRYAKDDFVALAVDLLSRRGGTDTGLRDGRFLKSMDAMVRIRPLSGRLGGLGWLSGTG